MGIIYWSVNYSDQQFWDTCYTPLIPKKVIASGTDIKYVTVSIGEPILKNRLSFKLLFQVIDGSPKKQILRQTTGEVIYQCTHPSPYLLPKVLKEISRSPQSVSYAVDDVYDGHVYRQIAGKIAGENAGKYKCYWDEYTEVPTDIFDVVIFEPEMRVTVVKRNSTGK